MGTGDISLANGQAPSFRRSRVEERSGDDRKKAMNNTCSFHSPARSLQLQIFPRRSCLVKRYDKPDDRPTHRIVLQADPSVVGFNKRLANGKPKAEAIG